MDQNKKRPEWAPEDAGRGYATQVVPGVEGGHDGLPGRQAHKKSPPPSPRRRHLTLDQYIQGVLSGDRTVLGRAITLVESNSPLHMEQAQAMLKALLPHTEKSMRVGVTGVPGAGKSTFIEALGNYLCDRGRKVAVLAVDPSSSLTRGSILGDKTRMEKLARRPEAFIRPSPTGGALGGVTRKSRETMLVCEAAGYDVILVETVGVGQSEIAVRNMVDFFLLVLIAGAGDELQGLKRGVMELTDAVLINKADGDNKLKAEAARLEFEQVLNYLKPATRGWKTRVRTCSALIGEGIEELWQVIEEFRTTTQTSGVMLDRRRNQALEWVNTLIEEFLSTRFWGHPGVKSLLPEMKKAVVNGDLSPTAAAETLMKSFETDY